MSTKIYNAYKVPLHRLNEAVEWWHRELLAWSLKHATDLASDAEGDDLHARVMKVIRAARINSFSDYRSFYDLECGIRFFLRGRFAYIIPYGGFCWNIPVEPPSWMEDYAYWNNTDHPDTISRQAWQARAKVWREILPRWDQTSCVHEAVSLKTVYSLSTLKTEWKIAYDWGSFKGWGAKHRPGWVSLADNAEEALHNEAREEG